MLFHDRVRKKGSTRDWKSNLIMRKDLDMEQTKYKSKAIQINEALCPARPAINSDANCPPRQIVF